MAAGRRRRQVRKLLRHCSLPQTTEQKRRRSDGGGYRRDDLRAPALRVEVDVNEVRIMGRRAICCARSSPLQAQKRRIWRVQFCTELASPTGFEPVLPP
jgi:hypothetical protein